MHHPGRTAVPLLKTAAFDGLVDVVHGFTTRVGGVSVGQHGALNLAPRSDEAGEVLVENWRRVAAEVGLQASDVALLTQVHGARVVQITAPTGPLGTAGDADGAWTTEPGILLGVRVADCVPVLLAAPGGVAIAHAGWRGTAAGVVPATVRALAEGVGVAPDTLAAAIGPHISGERYEVGDEVVEGLRASGLDPEVFLRTGPTDRPYVDLGAAVEAQLRAAGVGRIARLARCTRSEDGLHSYRRDGVAAGRLAGVIARVP